MEYPKYLYNPSLLEFNAHVMPLKIKKTAIQGEEPVCKVRVKATTAAFVLQHLGKSLEFELFRVSDRNIRAQGHGALDSESSAVAAQANGNK